MFENNRLTRDADYLLCILYHAYCERRKNGSSIEEASLFGGSEEIQHDYARELPTHDIDAVAKQLEKAGMLNCLIADLALCECEITPEGIAYMEHRFGDKLDLLLRRISALRP